MPQQVVQGALMMCSFGAAPATLSVLPTHMTQVGGPFAATIMDHAPMVNIPSFGMCSCPGNPAVVAATSAALGVFTPAPCVPATAAPWTPGAPMVQLGQFLALDNTSKCMCTWGGVISISQPGQMTVEIP